MQHVMCRCIFLGKGSLAFISHSKGSGTPFRSSEPVIWFFGLPLFLGYMLSQPPFSFCSLSPHPLGVPGAHLWPSPRLQAPFPAGYQPGSGLLPTHVHCAPGNTVSASSRGLCLGLGEESREEESPSVGQGKEVGLGHSDRLSHCSCLGFCFLQCGADSLGCDRLGCFNLSIRGHG